MSIAIENPQVENPQVENPQVENLQVENPQVETILADIAARTGRDGADPLVDLLGRGWRMRGMWPKRSNPAACCTSTGCPRR